MSRQLIADAEALIGQGQLQRAMDLLSAAARADDPDALVYLGKMSLSGRFVPRDLALSRELFRRAALGGSASGAAAYRAFVANGTGAPPNWSEALRLLREAAGVDPKAQRELDLIAGMKLTEGGEWIPRHEPERLSSSPQVLLFRSLFSAEECDFLIDMAMPALQPSKVVDPETGAQVPNPIRTSSATAFPLIAESPAVHALCRRLAVASGTKVGQGEPLQVLRYRPGQEYKPHFDAISGADNQRIMTFLVYLNDDFRGGETKFLKTGLRVKGHRGDGLLFHNANTAGQPDLNSQHAGLPVTEGEKFLASRWIRERPLVY